MTIFGWDASHYDAVPQGSRVVAEGFKFMTHKAGGDANDAELGAWWNALKGFRSSLLLGAYWVQYPGSPSDRADRFIARLDDQCPGWRDGPFILQVDCEIWGGNTATKPGRADIKAFCDRLRVRAPKLVPIVYAPKWAYGDSLSGLGYPLWASSYVNGVGTASDLYPGDASGRWGIYSGQVPAILQFTSSATIAGQTTCDANAYRGTLAQLTALLAPGFIEEDIVSAGIDKTDVAVMVKEFRNTGGSGILSDTERIFIGKQVAAELAGQFTSITALLAGLPTEVVEALAGAEHTDEEIAAALRAALGDRADAVGRLLSA